MDLRVSLLPAIRHLKQMSEVIEFDEYLCAAERN